MDPSNYGQRPSTPRVGQGFFHFDIAQYYRQNQNDEDNEDVEPTRHSRPEPVIMEFPEIPGHFCRDYWLAIVREILYAHKFIRKYQIKGVQREEALSKAVLGILRLQALCEIAPAMPLRCEAILMFNLADQLPGGDLILEALAITSSSQKSDCADVSTAASGMYSISVLARMSSLG
eukprot:TRINITY_DN4296_c0_g1_i17.p1 TRINITY_DN4296_c0_g1~~TRINITY_DN4296_c0_g1_i17.p1  ORF type:complete len:176 (+),score=27.78 TRINITY_DN4296_c0_g1_i17:2948-3475(+)